MPEFLKLTTPDLALQQFLEALPDPHLPEETIPTLESRGRILANPVRAAHALPPYTRSSVDGFAVRAADTYGASASLPAYLTIAGEIPMGQQAQLELSNTQTALVHTGGMIPAGADAVVMVEDTQLVQKDEVEILKPVSEGENILHEGEDVQAGAIVLERGKQLRPQEIGGLLSFGYTQVSVFQKPKVGILSTGDEVVPPQATIAPGQIRDINSYTLSLLVEEAGGIPVRYGIIKDNYESLLATTQQAFSETDMVVITAGSSVSYRDITAQVIEKLGSPGVLVHGVAIRPGKPTILAIADNKPIIGLPGNPVSALVVAGMFVRPAIKYLLATRIQPLPAYVPAQLALNISSVSGREDYIAVRLEETEAGYLAHPIFGRSNLIFTLVRADGLICIPAEATGLPQNAAVQVRLF